MRTTGDTTPDKITEIHDDQTPIIRIDENKIVKKICNGACDCKECDDISGDNVTW